MSKSEFTVLFNNWYSYCYNVCFSVLRNHVWVEDAIQEGFMDIWERPPQVPGPHYFKRVMYRRAIDVRRKEYGRGRERREFVPIDDLWNTLIEPNSENYILLKVSIERLLSRVKERDAKIFRGYYINGGRCTEAQKLAGDFDLSTDRIWQIIRKVRGALRKGLYCLH